MSKYLVTATWDDVPHLTKGERDELFASIPPHQRDARTKGIPQLGSGAIYPIPEEELLVDPFEIPNYWPRGYGLDVGWNRTAAIWGAQDRQTDTLYLWSEHYRGHDEPVVHSEAIKSRGAWILGAIDPASRGRSQVDGKQLMVEYNRLGLKLMPAANAVEAGLFECWTRMAGGRLKVFKSLSNWRHEFRLYQRDEDGKVLKRDDHCLHPGTLVCTEHGHVRLSQLVGKSGN